MHIHRNKVIHYSIFNHRYAIQVMAGVIGIYGLIVSVILSEAIPSPLQSRVNVYSIYTSMAHLAAGLCCGISGLAAGGCIGIVGDMGIRAVGYRTSNITIFYNVDETQQSATQQQQSEGTPLKLAPWGSDEQHYNANNGANETGSSEDQNKLFVGMLIILIFSEALALYGLIVALIVSQSKYECG